MAQAASRAPAVVLGACVDARDFGGALVVDALPILPVVRRRRDVRRPRSTCARFTEQLIDRYAPRLIAVVAFDETLACIELVERPHTCLPVSLEELAERFRALTVTRAAVRRALCATYPRLGALVQSTPAIRTESERYWEAAILASGAAILATEQLFMDQPPSV